MPHRAAEPVEGRPVTTPAPAPSAEGYAPAADGERGKSLRADAQRNREALLAAASAAFAARGVDASLEEIARQAGVGIGTLYRHFPTRDAVVEAVYRHEVEVLCDSVGPLLAEHEPDEALSQWMQRFVRYVATKRGLAAALKSMVGADSELFRSTHERITTAVNAVLGAAVDAGTVRSDVDPRDLMRAMGGICLAADQPDLCEQASRLVALLMDGLRFGAPGSTRGKRATKPAARSARSPN